ncbi:MAG: VIT1/CCC1 transporter family protein [Thermoplasmata archaeon]|nr:VIT1/CCC1 transporter family protein [Thermoplasmata archaeon]
MGYREWREKVRYYGEITEFVSICRRYFVIGSFDGALTILGLVLGAYFAGAGGDQVPFIAAAGVSAAVALSISSIAGAYEVERVEKKLDQKRMERALLTSLSEEHEDAYRFAARISAIVHGLAPLMAAIIPLIPLYVIPDYYWATVASTVGAFLILFITGFYLGRLVEEFALYTGVRFILVGLATAAVVVLLGQGL